MKMVRVVKVDQEIFKRIKKYKKVIYVDDAKELKNISPKEKVLVEDALTMHKVKRKVINVYEAKNYEDLASQLGNKIKFIYPKAIKDDKDEKRNLMALEFKSKKKIVRKLLLGLMLVLIIALIIFLGKEFVDKRITKSFKDKISEIDKTISYVVIEINPSMILEIVNDKVINKGCLNEDCVNLFSDIDVYDKSLNNIIEELYNKALLSELDLKDGVKVFSNDKKIGDKVDLPYVSFETINREEELGYIESVIDNNNIRDEKTKRKSNDKRLDIYKKDSLYGKYYECRYDVNDLECFITEDLQKNLSKKHDTFEDFFKQIKYIRILESILERFNIKYGSVKVEGLGIEVVDNIYLNGKKYQLFGGVCVSNRVISIDPQEKSKESSQCFEDFSIEIEKYDDLIDVDLILFSKLDLIKGHYNEDDIIELRVINDELSINKRSVLWQN